MALWGCLEEFPVELYEDVGRERLQEIAEASFARICQRDHVALTEEPTYEWALLPAFDWDDPKTGETIHIAERWAVRMTADAEPNGANDE